MQGRRHAELAPEAPDPPVQVVDLGRTAGLDVLEHGRLVAVGDIRPGGVVDQLLGIGVEHDALGIRDRLALVDEPRDEGAEVGPLADTAVREARERADRVRRRVEDHLAPLAGACVVDRMSRHSRPRARVGEPLDGRHGNRPRLVRPERRVSFDVPLHDPRLEKLAGGERRSPDDALDVRCE